MIINNSNFAEETLLVLMLFPFRSFRCKKRKFHNERQPSFVHLGELSIAFQFLQENYADEEPHDYHNPLIPFFEHCSYFNGPIFKTYLNASIDLCNNGYHTLFCTP